MSIPTILIVDDDPSIRFAFQKTFEPKHYRTIEAENGHIHGHHDAGCGRPGSIGTD